VHSVDRHTFSTKVFTVRVRLNGHSSRDFGPFSVRPAQTRPFETRLFKTNRYESVRGRFRSPPAHNCSLTVEFVAPDIRVGARDDSTFLNGLPGTVLVSFGTRPMADESPCRVDEMKHSGKSILLQSGKNGRPKRKRSEYVSNCRR